MILDDDPSIRVSLVEFLNDFNFEAIPAENAEQAFDILGHRKVEMFVVDIRLPGMNGINFILAVYNRNPKSRFVIHTGLIAYQLSGELKQIGVKPEHVFLKPVQDLMQIKNCLQDLISWPNC